MVTRRPPLVFSKASSSFFALGALLRTAGRRPAALGGDADEQVLGGEVLVAELLGALRRRRAMTASSSRLGCGGATVEPGHAGQRGQQPLGAGPYGGLVGLDGGQQVDDVLVVLRPASSASSRCAGVRSACPSVTARLVAALIASRLLL